MHSTHILRQLIKNSASQSSAHRQLCLLRLRRINPVRSLSTESTGSSSPVPPPLPPQAPSDSAAAPSNPGPPEDDKGSETPSQDIGSVHSEELARVKARRARISTPTKDVIESMELPAGLDIFWLPQDQPDPTAACEPVWPTDLPPPEILDEAHNNLLITLQPLIQHRATYPPPNSDHPTEPTFGLYCPIEGGEYIIDATVKELARRTGADVVVLDSVQLAAGEWGHFGKAGSSLQLPVNPLKVPANTPGAYSPREADQDFDEEDTPGMHPQGMMTLTLLAPPTAAGRSVVSSSRRPTRSKMNAFFDALVNAPSSNEGAAQTPRPRIIYVRDFTTLAATSSVWYAPLLTAVRQRRRGPISRPASAISNPITIVFGMTPPLQVPTSSHGGPNTSVVNFLVNQNASHGMVSPQETKPEVPDWSESEAGERARERRLQDRLKKWERHEVALLQELPRLTLSPEDEGGDPGKGDVIVVGPNGGRTSLPSLFGGSGPAKPLEGEKKSSFFRTSVLVPAKRSHPREKETRVARRREINELTMRMGIGAVGGRVEPISAAHQLDSVPETSAKEAPAAESADEATSVDPKAKKADATATMWENWGERIEVWPNVKKIADSAVGRVLSDSGAFIPSLTSTVVPWSTVESAWKTCKASKDHRKTLLKDLAPTSKDADSMGFQDDAPAVDELVERVRDAADLDQYEQRLLGCIVDAPSMPTSFKEVHLPPHVIDSVRTIVSLPLLHPHAFQQGILKQHGMTGCLLFGPPGTGKTLTVRALAREAGCRMLVITPSDIMDMYVGEAEKLVRATFSLARRLSPCVVFLDELDALFGARMAARESGGAAAAHRGVITEFMQEMDGLKSSREDGVIVIGATNRPFDLDDAILRRLPRRLLVDLPGEKEREEILKILLKDETIGEDVTPHFLAKKTESFSGSDLKHLCVSAALDAVKENVQVPWATSHNATSRAPEESIAVETLEKTSTSIETAPAPDSTTSAEEAAPATQSESPTTPSRTLHLRNFLKALKEITPSSSEALGSLADLRKWNEEFGEGRAKKKYQVWGKGRFGFVDEKVLQKAEEGKVVQPSSSP